MRESLRTPRVERGGCKQLQDCLNSSVAAPGESEARRKEATHQAPWLLGPIQAEKEPRCPRPQTGLCPPTQALSTSEMSGTCLGGSGCFLGQSGHPGCWAVLDPESRETAAFRRQGCRGKLEW